VEEDLRRPLPRRQAHGVCAQAPRRHRRGDRGQNYIEELKDFFRLLSGFYTALDQLFLNGRQPIVNVRKFNLPPNGRNALSPGERVYAEGHEVLRMVSVPDPEEERYNAGILA
jgi:hypothetical protein